MSTREYFAARFAAQEARKDAHAGDHAYATQKNTRFQSAAEFIDTEAIAAPGLRMLTFTLPMPPSVNTLYGQGHNGAKFLLPDQKHFRATVISIVRDAMCDAASPLAERIEMRLRLFYANKRRTDISNRIKSLEDALTHAGAYLDDSQIDRLTVERILRPGTETCEVSLRELAA